MAEFWFKVKFTSLILVQFVLARFGVTPTYGLYVRTLDPQKVGAQNTEDLSQVVGILFMVAVILAFIVGGVGMVLASRCGP